MSELAEFNVPFDTMVISETNLSTQSMAPVLRTSCNHNQQKIPLKHK